MGYLNQLTVLFLLGGISCEHLHQVRFTYAVLQQDKPVVRRLKNARHWIIGKIRLPLRLKDIQHHLLGVVIAIIIVSVPYVA